MGLRYHMKGLGKVHLSVTVYVLMGALKIGMFFNCQKASRFQIVFKNALWAWDHFFKQVIAESG